VFEALSEFGAPVQSDGITPATFVDKEVTYQIGIAPVRIVLTQITGVDFKIAWKSRVSGSIFNIPVHFISLEHLVANKRATGRSSDLEQLEKLGNSGTVEKMKE
jgi:hypothetical protein